MRLLKLAVPSAVRMSHSTLNWEFAVTVVTAWSDTGTSARAGSVFIATWSIDVLFAFSTHSIASPAPLWYSCVFAKTMYLPAVGTVRETTTIAGPVGGRTVVPVVAESGVTVPSKPSVPSSPSAPSAPARPLAPLVPSSPSVPARPLAPSVPSSPSVPASPPLARRLRPALLHLPARGCRAGMSWLMSSAVSRRGTAS